MDDDDQQRHETGSSVRPIRIALVGLSGTGKSTCARMLRDVASARGRTSEVLKLADPLYRMQRSIYELAGRPDLALAQDQELLYDVARHLRRINPRALADDFIARVDRVVADVVINDDLRDLAIDLPAMLDAGFRVVRVVCEEPVRRERLLHRNDTTRIDERAIWNFDDVQADEAVDTTSGDLDALASWCEGLLATFDGELRP